MVSRSRTSPRLLPSRWRCGTDRRRRCIRGPRIAWVFSFGLISGIAAQSAALNHIQPRVDHEGRQNDGEEQKRKK